MTMKPKRKAQAAKPVKRCTLEQVAAIDFEPWQYNPTFKLPTLEGIGDPHLIHCRLAYGIMHKAKPDLVKLFSDAKSRNAALKLIGDLEVSQKFFLGAAELIEVAHLRLIVAGSSFTEAA